MRILDNRLIKIVLMMITAVLINIAVIIFVDFDINAKLTLKYTLQSENVDMYQVFFSVGDDWSEENSIKLQNDSSGKMGKMIYELPRNVKKIRLDLGEKKSNLMVTDLRLEYLGKKIDITEKILDNKAETNNISNISKQGKGIKIITEGMDPYVVLNLQDIDFENLYKVDEYINYVYKILMCTTIDMLLILFAKKQKKIMTLTNELYNSRRLIVSLAKSDFKTKYAGSYLGITWAFVQPIVTVIVYWFVFQVGFKSAPIKDFPFILWLIAGLVPWFFFSEALTNATNSLLEYSYLVKKVVFKISILPIIKILSALFVHLFFIFFAIFIFTIYGYKPNTYMIQILYYTLCMFVLTLGISYITSSCIIFFKDLGQIISIVLQVGMWITPIMWNFNMIPEKLQWIFKINPMYYIVEGYRDSMINQIGFWEKTNQTVYFWLLCIGILIIGSTVFKRLKNHFADVL